MQFDMGEVFGIRRETGREEPAWLMCDDAMSLAIRDVAIDFLRIHEDDGGYAPAAFPVLRSW